MSTAKGGWVDNVVTGKQILSIGQLSQEAERQRTKINQLDQFCHNFVLHEKKSHLFEIVELQQKQQRNAIDDGS